MNQTGTQVDLGSRFFISTLPYETLKIKKSLTFFRSTALVQSSKMTLRDTSPMYFVLFHVVLLSIAAKFRTSLKSTEIDNLDPKMNLSNWVCPVGNILVDPLGVFCTILKPPNAHMRRNPKKNARKLII